MAALSKLAAAGLEKEVALLSTATRSLWEDHNVSFRVPDLLGILETHLRLQAQFRV